MPSEHACWHCGRPLPPSMRADLCSKCGASRTGRGTRGWDGSRARRTGAGGFGRLAGIDAADELEYMREHSG